MSKPNFKIVNRALVSVSDKSELINLAKFLIEQKVEILSTGGSAKTLVDAGIPVKEVSNYTGFPEIMDGRVKTLHPKIHGGLLGRSNHVKDQKTMEEYGILPIELVIVNLYPFENTLLSNADYNTCIENIDIGGPAMIRSAAKNHASVCVIVDPQDYNRLITEMMDHKGATSLEFRKALAAKAYRHTGSYDAAISNWFTGMLETSFPERLNFSGTLKQELRYGENPHQTAAFYTNSDSQPGLATATQLQGKELSFNNFNDTDAAFELISEFKQTACAIIKHANPSGVALSKTPKEAYLNALSCDPESAFGGVVALNVPIDGETAEEIIKLFAEVIIAPKVSIKAKNIFKQKKQLRVLETGAMQEPSLRNITVRSLAGGYLVQERDAETTGEKLEVVTKRTPTKQEMNDLIFAFTVCKHVKSNAIVYAKNSMTVGIGAGQMSRVNSSRIATWKAEDTSKTSGESKSRAVNSVVASDAFFPFADGLIAAAKAGITAIIQPGGSIRDDEVIAAANENNLAMVFTGTRHFRH